MKTRLLLILVLLSLPASGLAQKPAKKPAAVAQRFIVKKQVLVDDVELQLKDIPYAAVRVYIRYKLAEWLWKKGPDDTDRAEALAVRALEEAYAKKDELVGSQRYKLVTDLFGLLDTNAKETSAKLKTKYDLAAEDDLFGGFSQLSKKDGDQAVAQKMLKALAKHGDLNQMINPLMNSLRTLKSPQFPVVLAAFIEGVESGRVILNNNGTLYMFANFFTDPQIALALRARYFALVVDRARKAAVKPDPIIYEMLSSAIANFGDTAPDLLPEAMGLKNALAVHETAANKAKREAQERIDAASDRLAATIEEAERAELRDLKHSFYFQAEMLAKNSGKFAVGIDIIDTLREGGKSEFMDSWSDQEYADIAKRAFEKDEVEIALTATERIADTIDKAEAWKAAAGYFNGKKEPVAARDAIGKMLKLLAEGDREDPLRANTLVRSLPWVQRVDAVSMADAITIAARAVNDLPTPGIDDKPGTKKYYDYVYSLMWIDYSLASTTYLLLARQKSDAIDLAERIQRREARIVADMVLAIDALETAQKEAEKKEAAEKKTAPAKPQ